MTLNLLLMPLISFKNLGAGITLTKSEIKDIKILWSLENRGILLKGTTKKITSQEGFKFFFRQLRTAGLPLIKNVLTPIMKNVMLPFGLSVGMSAVDAAIQKQLMDQELQY